VVGGGEWDQGGESWLEFSWHRAQRQNRAKAQAEAQTAKEASQAASWNKSEHEAT